MGLARILKIIALLLVAAAGTYAQTGSLHGSVSDSLSHEPLIGARVQVVELDSISTVDANGEYKIDVLHVGIYTLRFTYIGYKTLTVKDVQIRKGMEKKLDVVMQEVSSEGLQIQTQRKWNGGKD